MPNDPSKKEKLFKFLVKETPRVIPWIGEIWKDAIDEFTESDVDRALKRIEGFQQKDHETQVAILLGILMLQGDVAPVRDFVVKMEKRMQRQSLLLWVLRMNWGNARFLFELQKSEESFSLNANLNKQFRDGYLDMLEELAEKGIATGVFHYVDGVVAFPEGYSEYAGIIRNPELEKPSTPLLIERLQVHFDPKGSPYFEGGKHTPVPFLPTMNGFINSIDNKIGLPNSVSDRPSEDYHGAYYWVRPKGLRAIAVTIGVLDPLETLYGMAIWWSWNDRSPLIGLRPVVEPTEKFMRQLHDSSVQTYVELMKKYEARQAGV